jgi:Putative auto-transporter adhesin, head GIN domain
MQRTRSFLLTAFVLAVLVTSGCHGHINQVVGSGNRQTQKRDIPSFTKVSTEGAFEIEITAQGSPSLGIEADDNILPLISTVVSNDVLTIKSLRSYSRSTVKVRLTAPDLQGLSVVGAGSINVAGLKNEKFEIDSSGAAHITVAGETAFANIVSNGASTIDAHKLRADRVVIQSNGVSDIKVYASDQLDVTISGPSHVEYEGNPKVTKTMRGPGSVEKKESGPA